jgi:hypothetical protein
VEKGNPCKHQIVVLMKLRLNLPLYFILRGAYQNNDMWTWGIERLAFPFFERKDYDSLFVNPWIKYDIKIK